LFCEDDSIPPAERGKRYSVGELAGFEPKIKVGKNNETCNQSSDGLRFLSVAET